MVPRVKVLGVFSRENGELVADLIEIPVTCSLENQVRSLLKDFLITPCVQPIRIAWSDVMMILWHIIIPIRWM